MLAQGGPNLQPRSQRTLPQTVRLLIQQLVRPPGLRLCVSGIVATQKKVPTLHRTETASQIRKYLIDNVDV